jgi:hypothetical protein
MPPRPAETKDVHGWTVKAEYLYIDFGTVSVGSTNLTTFTPPITFPTNVFTHSVDLKASIARIGINCKFRRRPSGRELPIGEASTSSLQRSGPRTPRGLLPLQA